MKNIYIRAWGGKNEKHFVYFSLLDGVNEDYFIDSTIQPDGSRHIIDKEDVCAFELSTGIRDMNGRYIYDGDICSNGKHVDVVHLDHERWKFWVEDCLVCYSKNLKIIGNIHENPELLNV